MMGQSASPAPVPHETIIKLRDYQEIWSILNLVPKSTTLSYYQQFVALFDWL